MRCLEDAEIQALMDGGLDGERLAYADSHIDSCPSCRSIVTALARSEHAEPSEGERIGRFVVLETIGAGAMGVVLAAYDRELDRKVALKLLRRDAHNAAERMKREAQAMAKLSHPNVVHVYDVGTEGDRTFVAMELVERAETLRAWMRGKKTEDVLAMFVQAGRGLAAAHDAGLVHRDFKPENVVVGTDGRARVTDFGLARGSFGDDAVDERAPLSMTRAGVASAERSHAREARGSGWERDPASPLAREGAFTPPPKTLIGTPAYMAPEQLDRKSADARSDQFAFCVALYEALAKKRPFAGETLSELRASMQRKPAPAGPSYVWRALERGLAIDPAARFPDMRSLLSALEPRAGRPLVWLALALLGAIGAGVAAAAFGQGDPCDGGAATVEGTWNDERRSAVERFGPLVTSALDAWASSWADEHGQVCRATRTGTQSQALHDARMACLDGSRRQVGALARQLAAAEDADVTAVIDALPDNAACRTMELPTAPPPRNAAARISRAERRIADARAAIALASVDRARESAGDAAGEARSIGWAPLIADAELARAHALRLAGALEEAERAAYASLFAAEEVGDDRRTADAWIALVAIAGERRDDARAAQLGRHAHAVLARAGRPRRPTAALANDLGAVYTRLRRFRDAHRALDRALALSRAEHGERSPQVSRVLTNLGNLARAEGELDAALAHHRAALAIDERALGGDHPSVARHHHNIAGILRVLDRREEALEHYERALAIKRAALGDDHLDVALTENSLGLIESELGHRDRARAHYRRALEGFARAHHADEAVVATNLALLEAEAGRHEGAIALFDRAIALASGDELARAAIGAAESARALDRMDDARRYAARAIDAARDPALDTSARELVAELAPRSRPARVPSEQRVAPTYLPGPAFE